ncbi:unnamed protein product [Brachionus calyciflorus]|uniref:Sodium/potassium-transporting ATPase subunit alpha n=1 Tax=Brachionus calyciflorus TaxID=104777 RepID=A0A814EQI7_9BILA|nr:unnamed protein product [Brachionus calyciflorus]
METSSTKQKYKFRKFSKNTLEINNVTISDEHIIPFEELIQKLETDVDRGLTHSQVYELLERDGSNVLTPQPKSPKIILFLQSLFGGFGILLLIGACLCFIASGIHSLKSNDHFKESLWLGIALIFVNLISGCFSFYQEEQCKNIIKSFQNIVPQKARVIRDGVIMIVKVENIVVGDIVLLKAGDKVPADLRILEAEKLYVDNSSLTGESKPQLRTTYFTHLDPLESKNLAFLGTLVIEGCGTGVVIRTGDRSFMGRIASLTSEVEFWSTPLSREITHFIHSISIAALVIGFLFFFISLFYGYFWIDSVIFLISILVAKVPEGLLATITVALTSIAKRISKKNCLVKNLEAVETLGSTTIICSDKTGTLTQNRMIVSNVWLNDRLYAADSLEIQVKFAKKTIACWKELATCCMLGSSAIFDDLTQNSESKPSINMRHCKGNPTEIALLKFMEITHQNAILFRQKHHKIFEIPFNSTKKYQLSVYSTLENDNDERLLVVMIGAPDILIEKSSEILINDQNISLDETWRKKIDDACFNFAKNGERVLAICDFRLDPEKYTVDYYFQIDDNDEPNFPMNQMRFIGLISMIDPPRAGVSDAVDKCKTAGIRVIMITGDHPLTAKAIAKSVGIITTETVEDIAERYGVNVTSIDSNVAKAAVITGDMLKNLSNNELDKILRRYPEIVFARTTPYQKVKIVESCQRLGAVVAVTGDGVNDSPALKKADIGIAMGIAGSDVSKEAADMILLDDDFASIEIAIEEGRLIFDNLKKSITYTLSSKIPELAPFIVYVIGNIPLALGTITILCIDLGTDLIPSISLVYEKSETDIMKRPPRNSKKDRLVNSNLILLSYLQYGMIIATAGYFTYTIIMAQNGFLPGRLSGIRKQWNSKSINDLEDSYGQEWTYEQRKNLERTSQTGFFVSVVMVQMFTLLVCKTRKNSIFTQGMRNIALNMGMLLEICLAIFLVYTPWVNDIVQMCPLKINWWFMSIPFGVMLFLYDELRKYFAKQYPKDWFINTNS